MSELVHPWALGRGLMTLLTVVDHAGIVLSAHHNDEHQ